MKGRLVEQRSPSLELMGYMVCVSCSLWNCWHMRGEPCDIDGCTCTHGNATPVQQKDGP